MTDENPLSLELRVGDRELAAEVETWLVADGAVDITVARERGMIDLHTLEYLVTATIIQLASLAKLGFWIRDKTRCRTVYDVRAKTILTEVDCQTRDGKILVITKKGTTVYEPETVIDLNKILKYALASS